MTRINTEMSLGSPRKGIDHEKHESHENGSVEATESDWPRKHERHEKG